VLQQLEDFEKGNKTLTSPGSTQKKKKGDQPVLEKKATSMQTKTQQACDVEI
jgi:hypothetical protein